MSTPTDRPRIASHLTKSRFLHIEDSLELRKLRFFIGSYERGAGAGSTAFAFLDLDDARVVLNDLAWGKQMDFSDYKGSQNATVITSRVLKIQVQDAKCWIQVQNGPGTMVGPGAVKPNGKPTAEISIALSTFEARRMALACLAYIQSWEICERLKSCAPGQLRS
jgi:hypothetical protein